MQTQNRLLDDLARLAGGAVGVAAGMRGEIEARLREQFEKILSQMDLVGREEFEAVRAVAAKARAEQEDLAARVAALEAQLGAKPGAEPGAEPGTRPAKPATAKRKAAPRKPAGGSAE